MVFQRKPGENRRMLLNAAAILAPLLFGCAHLPEARLAKHQPLASSWAEGRCSFSEGVLEYSDNQRTGQLRLDVVMENGKSLLCSSEFSAILSPYNAAITLGARPILEGREMLGELDGRMIMANSYELDLSRIQREDGGMAFARLDGQVLSITSGKGRAWKIDLSKPGDGWKIY